VSPSFAPLLNLFDIAFRLQKIALSNATVPQKLSTLAESTKSAFDAAVTRLRSLKLRPEQTALLYGDLLRQYKCVTTPAEFVAAFKANALTCASDDLVARLSNAGNAAAALSKMLARTSQRAMNLWSGADALAKYISISFPQALGDNIPQINNPYFNQNYSSAGFAGVRQYRNGQGLVNNIGYSATGWLSTNTYALVVYSKAAVRAAMRSDNEFYQVRERVLGGSLGRKCERLVGRRRKKSSHFFLPPKQKLENKKEIQHHVQRRRPPGLLAKHQKHVRDRVRGVSIKSRTRGKGREKRCFFSSFFFSAFFAQQEKTCTRPSLGFFQHTKNSATTFRSRRPPWT